MADNGNKRAALALKLSEDYDKLISTILIGNNIVNIMVASIGTLLFVGLYGDIGATVSTVVVTIVVLIFGEITPKSVAKDAPERFALFSAPFIRLWIWVLTPLNFLFSQWKKLVSRFFKTDDDAKMSHEELLLFMEDVEQDGGIDENEGELLRNALEFRDLTAAEILTHRIDLEAVDIGESHEEIARAFTQSRFSRLLVYRDTIDQIVGVLHQKDFYINGKMTDQTIAEIMTEPLFVYQHTKIRDILKMLQHQSPTSPLLWMILAERSVLLRWRIFWKNWSVKFGMNTTRWKKILKSWTRIPTAWTAPSAWRILWNSLTSSWNRTVFPSAAGSWSS